MSAIVMLTANYIKKHRKQQLAFTLTVCLFASLVLTMLFLSECFVASNEIASYEYYGDFEGQTFFADKEKTEAAKKDIENAGASVIYTIAEIETDVQSDNVYLGYMDKAARKMRAVRLKEGAFPKNDAEIALDQTAYYRLGLHSEIGDTVHLKLKINDKTEEKSFVLTGILYDYADHWNQMAENLLIQIDGVVKKDPQLPAVLTGSADEAVNYSVMYPNGMSHTDLGGYYFPNYEKGSAAEYVAKLNQSTAAVTFAIGVFFSFIALFGIHLISKVTMQDRYKFVRIIKNIGASKKTCMLMLIVQGVFTAIIAWLFSIVFSLIITYAVIHIFSYQNTNLIWSCSAMPPLITGVFLVAATTVIFFIQSNRIFTQKKVVKSERWQTDARKIKSFTEIWGEINRKSKYQKPYAVVLLSAACIFIVGFGLFSGETSAALHYYTALDSCGSIDYHMYIEQNAAFLEMLNAGFPRDLGMTAQTLSIIKNSDDLSLQCAYADSMQLSAFIKISNEEKDEKLSRLAEEYSFERVNNPMEDKQTQEIIENAKRMFGYSPTDILLVEPEIVAVDITTMKNLLDSVGVSMTADEEKLFLSGHTVYSAGIDFNDGQNLTISMQIIPDGSTATALSTAVKTAEFNVSVAKNIVLPDNLFNSRSAFPKGTPYNPCILISYDVCAMKDPQLRYTHVNVNNADPENNLSVSSASDLCHRAVASSKIMSIKDREENIENWKLMQDRERMPVYMLIAIFLLIILCVIAFINSIKLKCNIRSYSLLRVVGLEHRNLCRLLLTDNLFYTGLGVTLGLALAIGADSALIARYYYVPLSELFIKNVMLPLLLCCILLIAVSLLSGYLSMRSLNKIDCLDGMNSIKY